ncbi:uncharacterized protein TNCV_1901131 [Trichonephila clavipes]|nr:uncharacterized protein TNCV_1901131 [Trichonephila clavipes]
MSDVGVFGSVVRLETPDSTFDIMSRNNSSCSVLRSGLISIEKGLQLIDMSSELVFTDIWILIDIRLQDLSQWTTVEDMTTKNILDLVDRLSSRLSIGSLSYWIE